MNWIEGIFSVIKNTTLNGLGVERDLNQLLADKDISAAMNLFQNRDKEVTKALLEYDPKEHKVMHRKDKLRKGKEPYKVQKLPRSWQRYINEIALFFLLAKPIKWEMENVDENNDAFTAFKEFLKDTRFNVTMRQAKRLAGAETESAKLYHLYKDENNLPKVKVVVLSKSEGYTLRPLFDQYKNMIAFGYGYYLKEGTTTVEHFDIETSSIIYRCKKLKLGWDVTPIVNPTGKINVIYYQQPKEWEGSEHRIDRDEEVDSRAGDTNNYFADPMAKATADVLKGLADPDSIGKVIQLTGKDSSFEYVAPPTASDMKDSEKKVLKESILMDTFTPDFSYENMSGMGTLSGEALRRALIVGYIKRDNRLEVYDINVDREKNLILSIMMNVTHIPLKDKLSKLDIKHEFTEPFGEDLDKKIQVVADAYVSGVLSLEQAVSMLGFTSDPKAEIARIIEDQKRKSQESAFPMAGVA